MIKSFKELYSLDISQYISKKPTFKKDEKTGKFVKTKTELDYLNWADCLFLLHEAGAENLLFGNCHNADGHPLFLAGGAAPFVRVYVQVDGDRRELDYPVIDGSRDISPDKIVQSDIHNATQRGFVKCAAVNWGLGLSLWQKEEREKPEKAPEDDLSAHSIYAVKTRIERLLTAKMQGGMEFKDILSFLGINERQFNNTLVKGVDNLNYLETKLRSL